MGPGAAASTVKLAAHGGPQGTGWGALAIGIGYLMLFAASADHCASRCTLSRLVVREGAFLPMLKSFTAPKRLVVVAFHHISEPS